MAGASGVREGSRTGRLGEEASRRGETRTGPRRKVKAETQMEGGLGLSKPEKAFRDSKRVVNR